MSTKLGYFETIQNTDKPVFSHAKDTYLAGWVCDEDGNNEQYLMFADTELTPTCYIHMDGIKFDMGRLYSMYQSGKHSMILACNINGEDKLVKIPACKVRRALNRSIKNPEDVKERSLWDKLFN